VLLACAAVVFRNRFYGELPWIALTLGFTFGLYGLIRKVAPVSSLVGLSVETFAADAHRPRLSVFLEVHGRGACCTAAEGSTCFLIGTGVVARRFPLLCFNLGARRSTFPPSA